MVKRFLCIIFSALFIFSACGCSPQSDSNESTDNLLEFQGIPWNSTPEQVIELLGIPKEEFEVAEYDSLDELTSFGMGLHGQKLFGDTALSVSFMFNRYGGSACNLGLSSIHIYYPEDHDHTATLKALELEYGSPSLSMNSNHPIGQIEISGGGNGTYWRSSQSLSQILSTDALDEIKQVLSSDDSYILENPAVVMGFIENGYQNFETLPDGMTRDYLLIDASTYVQLMQIYGQ